MKNFWVSSALLVGLLCQTAGGALCAQSAPSSEQAELQAIEVKLGMNDVKESDVERLGNILAAHPSDAHAHYLAGKIYEHQGLTGLADEEFQKADQLAPNQSESVLESFVSKMEGNDVPGAMQDFGYLAERFPDDPSVLLMWSMIWAGKGKPDMAESYLKEALTVAPIRVGVAAAAGSLRLSQHRDKEALELARQDLAKDPQNYLANAVAGQACMHLGMVEEGGRYLRRAFAVRPLEKINDNAFAASFYKAGMYGDALAPAMVYMASSTAADELKTAKAQVTMIIKQLPLTECENVANMVDGLLKKTPFRVRFQLSLADVYDGFGWLGLAEHHYMTGIGIDSNVARAWYRLGVDCQKQGRLEDALMFFTNAEFRDAKDKQVRIACRRAVERHANRSNDLARAMKQAMEEWGKTRSASTN